MLYRALIDDEVEQASKWYPMLFEQGSLQIMKEAVVYDGR